MRRKAVHVACQFGLPMEEAEDVAQDVMLKLWCMHKDIGAQDPVEVLAAMMARRCCIDRWRLRKQEDDEEDALHLLNEDDPQTLLEHKELEAWLFQRIDHLPSTTGIILRMRLLEHRKTNEIATLLGISKASVATLLSRARRQLWNELRQYWGIAAALALLFTSIVWLPKGETERQPLTAKTDTVKTQPAKHPSDEEEKQDTTHVGKEIEQVMYRTPQVYLAKAEAAPTPASNDTTEENKDTTISLTPEEYIDLLIAEQKARMNATMRAEDPQDMREGIRRRGERLTQSIEIAISNDNY